MVSLDRCNGSCNTLDNPSGRIYVLNKTKDINLNVFNMIARTNEVKTLIKHSVYDCKYTFDNAKYNLNQK